jgi:teichoic acid transport system ATP-binding protein
MMSDTVINVSNITKKYILYNNKKDRLLETLHLTKKKRSTEFLALNDINFTVNRGDFFGIVGKNGSGKSTLLKLLTGVLTQTSGTIDIQGRISALLELGAGFNPEYTGLENVYLNGSILGFTRQEMNKKLADIIEFADIGEYINQPVKLYSSGMYVRLAFSVAINVDPDILIVDEALAVGDLNFQLKCMAKFDEFRAKNVTILFVSHDINSVKKFCDHAIWLKNGRIESIGETDLVTDRYLDYLRSEIAGAESTMDMAVCKPEESDADHHESDDDDGNSEEAPNGGAEEKEGAAGKGIVQVTSNAMCKIIGVKLLDEELKEIKTIHFGQKVYARLDFEMFSGSIDEISVGIAIHSIDNKYICGLNTMIDKFRVDKKPGKNSVYLEYSNFNLLGGTYYFDAAVFEKNAYVPLEYIKHLAEFYVRADYLGEGICILDHTWRNENEI